MNQSAILRHLAFCAQEDRLLARFRAQETEDAIEESLHIWRDTRAAQFVVAVHHAQCQAFIPLLAQMQGMEHGLTDLYRHGERAESQAAQSRSNCDEVVLTLSQCEKMTQNAEYHVADVHSLATTVKSEAAANTRALLALGLPPA